MSLIVTSGGLGPTADDLTAEVVGRFAGREMVLDPPAGGADRRDPAPDDEPVARPRSRRDQGIQSQAGGDSRRRDRAGPGGHRARTRGAAGRSRRPDGGRAARAAPRAPADVGDGHADGGLPARDRGRDDLPHRDRAPVRDPRVGDRQHAARRRGRRPGAGPARGHDLSPARRDRGLHSLRARGAGCLRRAHRLHRRAPCRHPVLDRRRHRRRAGRAVAGRTDGGGRGVVHWRTSVGAAHRPCRFLGLLRRRDRRLLQRGQVLAGGRRSRA